MKKMKQWLGVWLSVLVIVDSVPLYAAQVNTVDQPAAWIKAQESTGEQTETEENLNTEAVYFESTEVQTEDDTESTEYPTEREESGLSPAENTELPEIAGAASADTENPSEEVSEPEEETPTEAIEPVTEADPTGDENIDSTETETEWHNYYLYLNESYHELAPGATLQLSVDTDAPPRELVYESSDPTVASVSPEGLVTGVSGGTEGRKTVQIKVSWTNPSNQWDNVSATCYIAVQNTISLNRTSYTVYTGQKTAYQLQAKTNPAGTVTWKSSNTQIAQVDANGKITPGKAGTVTITATANGVSATCKVSVKKPSLSLKSKTTIYLKNPVSLNAKAAPGTTIQYKSSKPSVVSVNSKGVVTGKKTGTATITAKAHGVTKKCKVTVRKPTITVSSSSYTTIGSTQTAVLFAGSTVQMNAASKPAVTVKWKTSNKKVARVDKNGKVAGVKAGTATITAYIPGAKATYAVKVVKNPYNLSFTSRTMMAGNTATLYIKNLPAGVYPSFYMQEYSSSVSLTTDGNACTIEAAAKGTATIVASFWTYMDGYWTSWNQTCTVKVLDTGISAQQFSVARNTKKKLKLVNVKDADTIEAITWTSSAPKVASINKTTGEVTGKKAGAAKITAAVTYKNGKKKSYTASMRVSDPKLKSSTVVAALGGNCSIEIKGINSYSDIKWKSKKKSVVTVSPDGTLIPQKKGSTTVTATVDGKTLTCKVYISNPVLKSDYSALAPGGTAKISLSGLTSRSKVTYKSSNPSVAAVSKSGSITAKSGGRSEITVNADGKEFTYLVEVASQTAINACIEGNAIIGRSTYSQALRMTEGYYDCSSLVFRAYGRNSGLLGGSYSWAPTAAGMAQHMASTGKVISWGPVPVEDLRPGDLIFYGQENNGRYLGIYHVSMYYGNGYRLEKPMYSYYQRSNIVMVARPVP